MDTMYCVAVGTAQGGNSKVWGRVREVFDMRVISTKVGYK